MTLTTQNEFRTAVHVGPGGGAGDMVVLDTDIGDVHRDRDFGKIEAVVTLFVKEPGRPGRPLRILTHAEPGGSVPLRRRLIEDAIRLAPHVARRAEPLDRVA